MTFPVRYIVIGEHFQSNREFQDLSWTTASVPMLHDINGVHVPTFGWFSTKVSWSASRLSRAKFPAVGSVACLRELSADRNLASEILPSGASRNSTSFAN